MPWRVSCCNKLDGNNLSTSLPFDLGVARTHLAICKLSPEHMTLQIIWRWSLLFQEQDVVLSLQRIQVFETPIVPRPVDRAFNSQMNTYEQLGAGIITQVVTVIDSGIDLGYHPSWCKSSGKHRVSRCMSTTNTIRPMESLMQFCGPSSQPHLRPKCTPLLSAFHSARKPPPTRASFHSKLAATQNNYIREQYPSQHTTHTCI